MTTRMEWSKYFMGFAKHASTRASCPRATCGAAIVVGKHVVATGYNGAPPGHPHCIDDNVGCDMDNGHCQRALHAEENAIGQLVQHGHGIKPGTATLYIYRENITSVGDGPCRECRKRMMSSGIWDYFTQDGSGNLRMKIDWTIYGRSTNAHPDCTFPRGGHCCEHSDCPSFDSCCYHGTKDRPYPMDFVCGICNQKFPRSFYLESHMHKEHSSLPASEDGQHSCSECWGQFPTIAALSRHVEMVHYDNVTAG